MAKGTAIVIKTDGETERHEFDAAPSLEWLQAAVGGYIEKVPMFLVYMDGAVPHNCVAYCNEEGKIQNLPFNPLASRMWAAGAGIDVLVGDIVILFGDAAFMRNV